MNLKLIYLSSLVLCFMACKTNQESTEKKNLNKINITNCPEEGTCTFEVLKNKSLEIKTDGIGAQYPRVNEGKQTVLKFEYKKDDDPRIADDGYSEIIYAEIESTTKNLDLKDDKLSLAKVLFGRLCFCRGQTGYYPVEKGHFEIKTHKDETMTFSFNLENTKVPQILKEISVTLE